MIHEFDRFLIIEMMSDAYLAMEGVHKELTFLSEEMESAILNAETDEEDDIEFDVVPYLEKVKELENRKFDAMVALESAVEALPVELQEYDFKDDIEYKSMHDGIYMFLETFEVYARSIIETCLFFDYDLTIKWADDNGYFSEGE